MNRRDFLKGAAVAAAGSAAALAVASGDVRAVKSGELRDRLAQAGAVL